MKRKVILGILIVLLLSVWPKSAVIPADSQTEILTETKYVALTFDDGPKEGTTDRLLDGLRERGANATFFLVGEQVAIAHDLVKRIQNEGHQVGNHTWSHVRLEGSNSSETLEEIERNEQLLSEILGGEHYWLRPPYGVIAPEIEQQVTVPLIKWSVDPRDWESRNTDEIVKAILESVEPNSIILLHDIYPASVDAALKLVEELQREGYWFVTVEELLRLNGITPQAGVFYRNGG